MALTLRRRTRAAAHVCLTVFLMLLGAAGARAEDPAERAAQIRDEILARRHAHDKQDASSRAEQQREAAQIRLAGVRADLQAASERQLRLREEHDRLAARLAELDTAAQRERDLRRARVAAMYRAADLGAGAAALAVSTERIRLARYLIAAAAERGTESATREVERGSNIAALDRNRLEQLSAAEDVRRLEESRVVAENELARTGSELEAAAGLADQQPQRDVAALAAAAAELERQVATHRAQEALATSGIGRESSQELSPEDVQPPEDAQAGSDARAAEAEARALAERAKADTHARAKAEEARAKADEAKARAEADALALAQVRERAAQARRQMAADQSVAAGKASPPGSTFDWSDQRGAATDPGAGSAKPETGGVQRGQATGAQRGQVAQADAQGSKAAQPDAQRAKPASADSNDAKAPATAEAGDSEGKQGLLSRLFGGNEEAKHFAASKGSLAPPVAGKVMAKFGQKHENGATYRGVIVRAPRGSAVRSVAGGTVTFAGPVPGMGNTVIVSHGGGRYHTVYGRLGELRFKQGDRVRPGDVVGSMPGDDGDLDFEMRENGRAIDPRPWLRGAGDNLSQ